MQFHIAYLGLASDAQWGGSKEDWLRWERCSFLALLQTLALQGGCAAIPPWQCPHGSL